MQEDLRTFEHGDDAPVGGGFCDAHELTSHPVVVAIVQTTGLECVVGVRVEAGGDEQEVGGELPQRHQDLLHELLAPCRRARAKPHRHVA